MRPRYRAKCATEQHAGLGEVHSREHEPDAHTHPTSGGAVMIVCIRRMQTRAGHIANE